MTMAVDSNGQGPATMTDKLAADVAFVAAPLPLGGVHTVARRRRLSGGQWVRLTLLGVLLVLLGAAAGLGTALLTTPVYAAHADVLYLLTREQPTGFLREDRSPGCHYRDGTIWCPDDVWGSRAAA